MRTVFHKTKIDLQRWFVAFSLVLNAKKGISARQLARDINVNKNTAWYMLMRLRKAMTEDEWLLEGVVEADETYIGGKYKNKHKDKRPEKGGQGRSGKEKIAVFGVVQRGGQVRARSIDNVSRKALHYEINGTVKRGSTLMTDEWKSYNGLSKNYTHKKICHSANQYVDGDCHTNTIEGFWSLLKRGIMGQYHWISHKYVDHYIDEFCFRYNNRENEEVFEMLLGRCVNI